MGRTATGAVFAVAMVIVVVGVDFLWLRHHFWVRLGVNAGIVLASAACYFIFLRRR